MKKSLFLICLCFSCLLARAQESGSSFAVLKLPTHSHVAALGGENISLVEDAPAAGWSNPALYSNVSDRSLGLGFMTYAGGSKLMGAQFVKAFGERHTGAVTLQYMDFGSMDETDAAGNVVGSFSAKDMVVGASYSYLLSERWTGGATLKTVYSKYAEYSSVALAVDLGLNYYDAETDLSLSATMQHLGVQLKHFDGYAEKLPFGMQLGLTKGLNHLPVRLSVTMTDLTRWKSGFYYSGDEEKISFGKLLINHFVVGLDVEPADFLYLSAGYNFRRASELKAAGSGHGAGLSFGGGVRLSRFQAGISYAKYHVAASSLMFNASYSL